MIKIGSVAAAALFVMAVVVIQAVVLYPNVFRRREIITSSALGYGMAPWKGAMPVTARPLSANPILSDDLVFFAPWDAAVREDLSNRRLPVRTEWSGCGMPLLANNQSAVFAPAQSLRWLWPSPRARTIGLLLVTPIAALGAFVLFRMLRLSAAASAFGALAWCNASLFTNWLMYPLAETMAWFPWVLAGVRAALDDDQRRARKGAVLLGLSVGALLLAGHLPTAAACLIATAIALALWLTTNRGPRRRTFRLVVPVAAGLLLAAPQLVPFADYLLESQARVARTLTSPAMVPLPFEAAWSWLAPRGFGSPERYGYSGPVNFPEAVSSVGLAVLVLGLASPLLARRRVTAVALAGLAAACALTYGLPPGPWLAARIPVIQWMPAPRWTLIAQWCMVALATLAVERLLSGERTRRAAIVLGAVAAAALVAVLSHPALSAKEVNLHATVAAREILYAAGEIAAVGAATLAIALGRARTGVAVLAALVVVAGVRLASGFNPTIPPAAVPGRNASTIRLAEIAGDGRVLAAGWVMTDNTGALAGVRTVGGRDAMDFARAVPLLGRGGALADFDGRREPSPESLRLLRRTGATAVASDHELISPGLTPVEGFDERLRVYAVDRPHPMLAWYPEIVAVPDSQTAMAALASGRVAEHAVTVETAPGDAPPSSIDVGSHDRSLAVPYRRIHAARFEADASLPGPGWLVLRETAQRGWRVRVDGRSARWWYADGMFVGIPVLAGRHTVEFDFRPRHMNLAWVAAGIGLVGLAYLALRRDGRP